jgi:hypothetical protein
MDILTLCDMTLIRFDTPLQEQMTATSRAALT